MKFNGLIAKSIRLTALASLLLCLAQCAVADQLAYVVYGSQQFGTIDLNTGTLTYGPTPPTGGTLGYFGLAPGLNGSLLTFLYNGDVDSINPATGIASLLGPSGLGDCSIPGVSPCPPNSAFTLGGLAGKIYATDFQNSLYLVNRGTAAATLVAHSVIPAIPFIPGSQNPDGTLNFADEAIWGTGAKLYATFDAWIFNPNTGQNVQTVIAPALYRIDPTTGLATMVGPTALGIGAVVDVNGTYYAFDDATSQILSLDLSNGNTSFLSNCDACVTSLFGVIQGASPVPEPASLALIVAGANAILLIKRRTAVLSRFRR